jgi:hypothetical protein
VYSRRRAAERRSMFEEGAAAVDIGGESTRGRPPRRGRADTWRCEEIRRVPAHRGRPPQERPSPRSTRARRRSRRGDRRRSEPSSTTSRPRYDPEMAGGAEARAGAVPWHMKGTDLRTMQQDVAYAHPHDIASESAWRAVPRARGRRRAGPARRDPGFGFGKSPKETHPPAPSRGVSLARFPVAAAPARPSSGVFSGDDRSSNEERPPGSLPARRRRARGSRDRSGPMTSPSRTLPADAVAIEDARGRGHGVRSAGAAR